MMRNSILLLLCFCFCNVYAVTQAPDTWNIKDCVNSAKVRSARDACAKISTKHDEVEKCILKGVGIFDGANKLDLEVAKKLIDDYEASTAIKSGLKRDLTNCGRQRLPDPLMTCTYQVITKRCLMDPALKKASQTG